MHRSSIRKHSLEESASLSKAINPGNLKGHKNWITWSRELKNYLSTILGQDGVLISYVVRESEAPDYTIELQPDYNFEQLSINCVPLTGLTYKTYARKLYYLIHDLVHSETSETLIKTKERYQDGQLDYLVLLANYGGEGNKVVRIKESEALQTLFIYKNKRAISFDKFLKNMKMMFTGFSDNGDILNEMQTIRLQFQKVQNPILTQIKASLQVSFELDRANTVT